MKRKIYIAILTVFAILAISCSYCFANNTTSSAVDGIRNVVGGAENVVEDAGKGVAEGIRNITDAGENTMENMTSRNNMQNTRTTNNNTNYSATRTTARTTSTGNTGVNTTMWTWIIMAIVGIIIIALVWMYAKQNNTYNNKNNNY